MAKTVYLYDVYDNGKLIYKNISRKEIEEKLNLPSSTVYHGCASEYLVRKRYKFKLASEYQKPTKEELLIQRWNDVVEMFKNVEWVKSGGRKLEVKKEDK